MIFSCSGTVVRIVTMIFSCSGSTVRPGFCHSIWFGTNSMWQRCAVPFAAHSCFLRPKKRWRNIGACARCCSVVVCFSFVVREERGHTVSSEHRVEPSQQLSTAVDLDRIRHGYKKLKIRRMVCSCRNHRHPASNKSFLEPKSLYGWS